ncbi:MAG: serine hydrolase [Gemmatimonadales bacterium]
MGTKDLPALSIALVDDQDIVWARGFGYQNPGDSVPATANTVYRVGSVSKLFTDIAIMQLVEKGELDIDIPIQTYLPEFNPRNPFRKPITLRALMSHRSGLVREPPAGNYFDDSGTSLAQMVTSLNETELVYEPETRIKYSNAAIATAGYVLERTQGEPFAGYVKQTVLEPLGMTHSAFLPEPALVKDLATAYMWAFDGREYEAPGFQLGMAPAGSMYSTVLDLGKFMTVMFAGGKRDGDRILEKASLDSMWTPQFAPDTVRSGYGLGFSLSRLDGHRRIGHGGAIYGFATELAMLPDEKLGAIVVTSRDVANAITTTIANQALRAMLALKANEPIEIPLRTKPLDRKTVKRVAGRYANTEIGVDLYDWNGRLFGLSTRGGTPVEYRSLNDTLVVDGVTSQNGWILKIGPDSLLVGGDTLVRQARARPPPPAPDHWRGLIGEYGWDHNTLFIFEKDGQLHALIEWVFDYPLVEVSRDVFGFPGFGLYQGERLMFQRDANGRATRVIAASVGFERRNIEPGAGNTFRIRPLRPVDELRTEALATSPPEQPENLRVPDLVELTSLDSTIKLDVRYATTNNFMSTVFYEEPRAFMQRPAAQALVRTNGALRSYALGLLIHDAYRPWYVTKMFWDATPDDKKIFVANPANGSRHNRGAAVDVTLYDLRTGEPIRMVGTYDEMTDRSYPNYIGGTSRQRWYRDLLRRAMENEGFQVYEFEWWHFDYRDWAEYPVLNLPFGELR